uniref:Eukaryotic translation initiation factor 2 subunit 2 n=1 Tax=Parastrongyloides trichosuri TaxID=131310 RepID=A0A0N4ZH62_PARTI
MADEDLTLKLDKKKKKKLVLEDVDKTGAGDTELVLGKKKSKKKVAAETAGAIADDIQSSIEDGIAPGIGKSNLIDANNSWPDYSYDELLDLVFGIMREKNPELVTGDKKKFVMKPPQVARAGSKKTAFTNFAEICRILKRQHKHVLQFLLTEMGTTGSLDGNSCLIVKGRFQQKHFESVLRKYIKEYVTCHTCRSSDTELTKDTRLYFLQCKTCGSKCSVSAIKSGFTAMVGKRAALRRAAEATAGAK